VFYYALVIYLIMCPFSCDSYPDACYVKPCGWSRHREDRSEIQECPHTHMRAHARTLLFATREILGTLVVWCLEQIFNTVT